MAFVGRTALILGGARSGKSVLAERLCRRCADATGAAPVYVPTARPWGAEWDPEMARRIAEHRARRGAAWIEREAPLSLAETIAAEARADRVVLVDCLTLWLTNVMLAGDDPAPAVLRDAIEAAAGAIAEAAGPVICVSNEVGLGIVPETPLGRAFRDAQGLLNQSVARAADTVVFVAAGLPLALKGEVSA